jgi:hypothetical protein
VEGVDHEYLSPYQPDRLLWRQHRLRLAQHCTARAPSARKIKAQVADRSRAGDGSRAMPKLLLNACPRRQEQPHRDTGSPVSTGVLLYGQGQTMSFELGPIPPGNRGIGRIKRETRIDRSPRRLTNGPCLAPTTPNTSAGRLQVGSGDIAAGIRAQQQGRGRHLRGSPRPLHRATAGLDLRPCRSILATKFVAFSGDQARRKIVDGNAVGSVPARQIDAEIVLRTLRCGVDRQQALG